MRRSLLPPAIVVACVLAGISPAGAAPDAPAAPSAPAPPAAPTAEPDPASEVPALQAALGDRYGGYWIEPGGGTDTVHVQVVGATGADRVTVARLTRGVRPVLVDDVAHGYDELAAAQAGIAASFDPAAGPFSVSIDVPTNQVLVQTASADIAGVTANSQAAARQAAEQTRGAAGDPAGAVRVETTTDIAIEPVDRNAFPPYEGGLFTRVWVGSQIFGCTTGWLFANYYGAWGSTAGHCGRVNDLLAIGNELVDLVRYNSYQGWPTVTADTLVYSLSLRGFPGYPYIQVQGGGHRIVRDRLANAQITNGLTLCFNGIASDADSCGRVVRVGQTLCCDAAGHSYVFSCIDFASRPGDSGAPVYQLRGDGAVNAAGTVSANVTIGGQVLMCFSTAANIEAVYGPILTG